MNEPEVLIISADSNQSRILRESLEKNGFGTQAASLGSTGLQLLHQQKINLVIMDWKLPDINSLAILRDLRSNLVTHRLPVILIGGDMDEDERIRGLDAGADLCLAEPMRSDVFVARVRSLLRRNKS